MPWISQPSCAGKQPCRPWGRGWWVVGLYIPVPVTKEQYSTVRHVSARGLVAIVL